MKSINDYSGSPTEVEQDQQADDSELLMKKVSLASSTENISSENLTHPLCGGLNIDMITIGEHAGNPNDY